jgi:hypothetical protein
VRRRHHPIAKSIAGRTCESRGGNLCGLTVVELVLILVDRRKKHDEHTRKLLVVGALCFGALVTCLLMHQIAYSLFHLLMLRHRTAIFVAPFVTLCIGVIASIRPHSPASSLFSRVLLAVFSLTAVYFLMCLRLSYFLQGVAVSGGCEKGL